MFKIYNVAIYLRLSREDGDNLESESIKSQRDVLLNYISLRDELKYVDEYVDDGYSGSNFNRPGWQRLMKDIENKKINTIITKDLSRMGRDYIMMGNYIEREFPEKSIRYIAINDDLDTLYETPGLEYLQFKLVFNDYYLKDTSKKIRKILKSKKEQGEYTGWKGVYGYIRDPNDRHKLIVDENVRPIIVRMFNLAKSGKSQRQIAEIFSREKVLTPSVYANLNRGKKSTAYELWCPRTIEELLVNPTYLGHLTQGRRRKVSYKSKKEVRVPKNDWIIVKNTHEAIIDEETFNTVGELLRRNKNNPNGTNLHLLRGFLYCKECGHSIGVNRSSDRKRRYCVCNYYSSYSKFKLCTPHSMNYDKLENAVLNELKAICEKYIDSSNFRSLVEDAIRKNDIYEKIKKEISNLEIKINQATNNIDRLYLDKLNDVIQSDQYQRITNKLNEDIDTFNVRKRKLLTEIENISSSDCEKEKQKIIKSINEFLSFEKPTRALLVNLIDRIEISEDKTVEINYKFRVDSV